MGTTITLSDIEKMDRKDVVAALEFIAKKIGFEQAATAPAVIAPEDNPEVGVQLPPVVPQVAPAPTAAQTAFAPAPAAVVPAPAPTPAPTGIEVDKNGLPWDGRIHSSARSKVADGSWKMRRGVEADFVTGIENELRQTMGVAPVPVAPSPLTPPPATVFSQPAAPAPVAVPVAPVEVPAPPLASIAPAPVAAPVASAATPMNFAKLMSLITAAFAAKTLDQATINTAVQSAGLPSLPMLAARPDMVAVVADKLGLVA